MGYARWRAGRDKTPSGQKGSVKNSVNLPPSLEVSSLEIGSAGISIWAGMKLLFFRPVLKVVLLPHPLPVGNGMAVFQFEPGK